jgi:hypothetical protein
VDHRDPERQDRGGAGREGGQQRTNDLGPAERRQRPQREDRAADRKCRAAGERDDPVRPDEHARRRGAVEAEQRGHDREGKAREDRTPVGLHRAEHGERERGPHRDRGGEPDRAEVRPGADRDAVGAADEQGDAREDGSHRHQRKRSRTCHRHETGYRQARRSC